MTIHIACRLGVPHGATAVRISQPHNCIANAKAIQELDVWKLWITHYLLYNPGHTFLYFSGITTNQMPLGYELYIHILGIFMVSCVYGIQPTRLMFWEQVQWISPVYRYPRGVEHGFQFFITGDRCQMLLVFYQFSV